MGASPWQRVSASFDFVEFRHDSAQLLASALAAPSFGVLILMRYNCIIYNYIYYIIYYIII